MKETSKTAEPKEKATILVVDDQPQNVQLMVEVLEHAGYRTLAADSGMRALAVLHRERPDAILLDMLMPGMDGFEVIRRVREGSDCPRVPILVVTAMYVSEGDRRRLQQETQAIFQKGTFWVDEMLQELARILGPRAATAANP